MKISAQDVFGDSISVATPSDLDSVLDMTIDDALTLALAKSVDKRLDSEWYETILTKLGETEQDAFTMGLASAEIRVQDNLNSSQTETDEAILELVSYVNEHGSLDESFYDDLLKSKSASIAAQINNWILLHGLPLGESKTALQALPKQKMPSRNETSEYQKEVKRKVKNPNVKNEMPKKSSADHPVLEQVKNLKIWDELPEGWYVHGRASRQDLETGMHIYGTVDWAVAEQYAGDDGSVWVFTPIVDPIDMRTEAAQNELAKTIEKDYLKGGVTTEYVEHSLNELGYAVDDPSPDELSEAFELLAAEFNPSDIVNHAEAHDNPELSYWFAETYNHPIVLTEDGIVVYDLESIAAKRVEEEHEDEITAAQDSWWEDDENDSDTEENENTSEEDSDETAASLRNPNLSVRSRPANQDKENTMMREPKSYQAKIYKVEGGYKANVLDKSVTVASTEVFEKKNDAKEAARKLAFAQALETEKKELAEAIRDWVPSLPNIKQWLQRVKESDTWAEVKSIWDDLWHGKEDTNMEERPTEQYREFVEFEDMGGPALELARLRAKRRRLAKSCDKRKKTKKMKSVLQRRRSNKLASRRVAKVKTKIRLALAHQRKAQVDVGQAQKVAQDFLNMLERVDVTQAASKEIQNLLYQGELLAETIKKLPATAAKRKLAKFKGDKMIRRKAGAKEDFERVLGAVMLKESEIGLPEDPSDPVFVGITWSQEGYLSYAGALVADWTGSDQDALEGAYEITTNLLMEDKDYVKELEEEWGDEAYDVLTENVDGRSYTMTAREFVDAMLASKRGKEHIQEELDSWKELYGGWPPPEEKESSKKRKAKKMIRRRTNKLSSRTRKPSRRVGRKIPVRKRSSEIRRRAGWDTDEVSRWLLNDQGMYHDVVSLAKEAESLRKLADAIDDYVHAMGGIEGVDIDLDEVDWDEVADDFEEFVRDPMDDDEDDELDEFVNLLQSMGKRFHGNDIEQTAQDWMDEYPDVEDAEEWMRVGVFEPSAAKALEDWGLDAQDAATIWKRGMTIGYAVSNGDITPEQAYDFWEKI